MLHSFNHAQFCDQTCSFCAREWWAWLKARESQMATPMESKLALRKLPGSRDYYVKHGSSTSWSEAAKTSNVNLAGAKVRDLRNPQRGVGVVKYDPGWKGGDGRHWVGVCFGEWLVHIERHLLIRV